MVCLQLSIQKVNLESITKQHVLFELRPIILHKHVDIVAFRQESEYVTKRDRKITCFMSEIEDQDCSFRKKAVPNQRYSIRNWQSSFIVLYLVDLFAYDVVGNIESAHGTAGLLCKPDVTTLLVEAMQARQDTNTVEHLKCFHTNRTIYCLEIGSDLRWRWWFWYNTLNVGSYVIGLFACTMSDERELWHPRCFPSSAMVRHTNAALRYHQWPARCLARQERERRLTYHPTLLYIRLLHKLESTSSSSHERDNITHLVSKDEEMTGVVWFSFLPLSWVEGVYISRRRV